MNILYINKFFHINGGVERYFFDLAGMMQKNGHNVAFFSTDSNPRAKNRERKYFVPYHPFNNSPAGKISFALRSIYSIEAARGLNRLLDDFKPDIVHIHNLYHHLSPSILPVVKKRNLPVVQSVGDYHLIAPNYNLFHNGKICEITKPDKYYKAILHRCVKNSLAGSAAEVLEKYSQKILGWERNDVDLYLVPSKFMSLKMEEFGIDDKKISVLPHFTNLKKQQTGREEGKYILYFGRLSEEKGLNLLLDVIRDLPQVKLKIAGTGIMEKALKDKVKKEKIINCEFTGFLQGKELSRAILKSRFTVLPSLWYEVFGLSIIESFAYGKPVLASRIGAIPEVITDGENGILFEAGNAADFRLKLMAMWNNPDNCQEMGIKSRKTVTQKYNPENHLKEINSIYGKLRRNIL